MSTPLDLQVLAALDRIQRHVAQEGLDSPDGLIVRLPQDDGSEVAVSLHVLVEDPPRLYTGPVKIDMSGIPEIPSNQTSIYDFLKEAE